MNAWSTLFLSTISTKWGFKNHKIFKIYQFQPNEVTKIAKHKVIEYWTNLEPSHYSTPTENVINLHQIWNCPPHSWMKLNVDGSMYNSLMKAGGCIRNEYGCQYDDFIMQALAVQFKLNSRQFFLASSQFLHTIFSIYKWNLIQV